MRYVSKMIAVLVLSGCASTPPVQLGYYLPKTDISVRVVRTVACDSVPRSYSVVDTFVDENHSADIDAWEPLPVSALASRFSNSDLKVDYYPGRRLKAINSSYVGQGEAIAKSIAMLVLPRVGMASGRTGEACQYLKDHGDKGVLTLTYSAKLDFTPVSKIETKSDRVLYANDTGVISAARLFPDDPSSLHHHKLSGQFGEICINASTHAPDRLPVHDKDGGDFSKYASGLALKLREPGTAPVKFYISVRDPNGGVDCAEETRELGTKIAAYADHRGNYYMPIPKARAFGESSVDLQFETSGALAGIKFGGKSGMAGLGNALGSFADQLLPTDAQLALQIKAEADVIANQQRLLKCRLSSAECK